MEFIKIIKFDEIDRAPGHVGLYAWYGNVYASIADYKSEKSDGDVDYGEVRFRKLLAKHIGRFRQDSFSLRSSGPFGANWRGDLVDVGHDVLQGIILGDAQYQNESFETHNLVKTINSVVRDQGGRALVAKVLLSAAPMLSAPIYIGVTKNLKNRLNEHMSLYKRLRDEIDGDDLKMKRLQESVSNGNGDFAHRAVALEFSPEHLLAVYFDLFDFTEGKVEDKKLRQIAGVIEWYLNRMFRPLAGRK